MSSLSRKLSNFSTRRQSNRSELSAIESTEPDDTTHTLPDLPPEIWLLILECMPFDTLWLLRSTARPWNTIALSRAWELVSNSNLCVVTHNQIPTRGQPVRHHLTHLVPTDLNRVQMNRRLSVPDTIRLSTRTTIIWHAIDQSPLPTDLQNNFQPQLLSISFGDLCGTYPMIKARRHYSRFCDFARSEIWFIKSRPSKMSKFLSKSNIDTRRIPRTLEWNITYISDFSLPPPGLDLYRAYQIQQVMLVEVSLPLIQIVCAYIDALRHS